MRIESNGYTVKDIFGLGDGSIEISADGMKFTFDMETIATTDGEFARKDFELLLEAMIATKRKADQLREMLKRDEPAGPTYAAATAPARVGKPIDSAVMLEVLVRWVNEAKDNHESHSACTLGSKCWDQFVSADIRYMIEEAARETAGRLRASHDAAIKATA